MSPAVHVLEMSAIQVYALDFTFTICVVITGCGAAQPESTRTVAMQSERAQRLDVAGSFADALGRAAKPQVISEATAREDQLPMGVG
jgi:hypothetical protein